MFHQICRRSDALHTMLMIISDFGQCENNEKAILGIGKNLVEYKSLPTHVPSQWRWEGEQRKLPPPRKPENSWRKWLSLKGIYFGEEA